MSEEVVKKSKKELTKKELRSVFWRHYNILGNFNYERQQSTGYAWAMSPVLEKLYGDDPERLQEGYERHLEFFNCAVSTVPFIFGVSCAMEEQYSNSTKDEFDETSINAVKASLMGPLAGIGDSFFWGTFRVIGVGVGAPLAIEGNILGPLLYFLINFIPSTLTRYFGFKVGYKGGTEFLSKVSADGTLQKLTEAAKVLGLIVVGGMIASIINIDLTAVVNINNAEINIQEILDSIMPKLVPLLLTFSCYSLLQKRVNSTWLMFGLLLIGILGVAVGLLG